MNDAKQKIKDIIMFINPIFKVELNIGKIIKFLKKVKMQIFIINAIP